LTDFCRIRKPPVFAGGFLTLIGGEKPGNTGKVQKNKINPCILKKNVV